MKALVFSLLVLFVGCTGGAPRFNGIDPPPEVFGADLAPIDLLKARIAASNAHDWAAWEALHTETCFRTAPELKTRLDGRAEMRAAIERLVTAFPDYHVSLIRAVASGPWVAAELRSYGSFENALPRPGKLSIPATGKSFAQTWTAFIRIEEGRIAEIHEAYDQQDLNDQLLGTALPKPW